MSLHVLEPGLYSLIVDFGRPSYRSLGVPIGGAADRTSLALGNALVGNPIDTPALEISLAGPTLRADCDLACVLYGAPFQLKCGLQDLTAGKTFTLQAGQILRIGGTPLGLRGYLCVQGGFATPLLMGSRSALAPVHGSQELACQSGKIAARFLRPPPELDLFEQWQSEKIKILRVLPGPQADWFAGVELFTKATADFHSLTVTSASNRMGLRLQGDPLSLPKRELVSEPVCPGSVQVTRDGQCVILGIDGQTIGGYPKIAQIISADLDKLGQLRPGDRICFQQVSLEEAEQLYREKSAALRHWLLRLRTAEDF
jgi:antagonist of KipI